jgi:hypothetical protein
MVVAAVLGLGFYSSAETDPGCPSGYVEASLYTCESSTGLTLAKFFGANFALATLSLLWSLFRQRRLVANVLGGNVRFAPQEIRPLDRTAGYSPPAALTSIAHPRPPGDSNKAVDSEKGLDADSRVEEREQTEPSAHEMLRENAGVLEHSVTYEKREVLKFSYVNEVSSEQLVDAISAATASFRVTQETLTGLRLASLMKDGGNADRLHGVEICGYFLMGAAVGRALFPNRPYATDLYSLGGQHEREEAFQAAEEDAGYFQEISPSAYKELLSSLPGTVSQRLLESLEDDEVAVLERELLASAFVAGIAYLGFQSPTPSNEPTW